jgi:uncharacterized protein (DUF1810 family)
MSQAKEATDRYNLSRFTSTQQRVYGTAGTELTRGRKQTLDLVHFPQVDNLGRNPAKQYAIKSRDEAVAYLATPLLGARLSEFDRSRV